MLEATRSRTRRRTVLAIALCAGAAGVAIVWSLVPRAATDPNAVWDQGQAALRAGQIDRAEELVARLTRLRTPTPFDWMLRAQVALARNRIDEAFQNLDQIPASHQLAATAQLVAGQVELRRNRAREAEKHYLAAIRLDPKLIQAHRELIYLYGVQLRRRELNEQFTALSELTPLTFENVWHWCLVRNTVWEPRENSEIMARFLEADPDDRESRISMADLLRQLGRREEAEKTLSVLDPSDPVVRVARVKLALDRGDDQAAEALLADGPADDPGLALLRGRFALAHGEGPAAVRHFRLAYDANPDNRDAVVGLASALTKAGDHKAAAPFLAEARQFDILSSLMQRAALADAKKDPKLLRELGAACEAVHRLPEAKAWFKLAIALDPLDTEAQQALFRLEHSRPGPN
jgi:tetratricopeptide (TPR) repeat protein